MRVYYLTRKHTNDEKEKYFNKIERAIKEDRITLYNLDEFIKNTNCKIEIKYVCGELQIFIDDNNDKPVSYDDLPDDDYYEKRYHNEMGED